MDDPQASIEMSLISQTSWTRDPGDQYTGLDRFGRIVEQYWINTSTTDLTDDSLTRTTGTAMSPRS